MSLSCLGACSPTCPRPYQDLASIFALQALQRVRSALRAMAGEPGTPGYSSMMVGWLVTCQLITEPFHAGPCCTVPYPRRSGRPRRWLKLEEKGNDDVGGGGLVGCLP